MFHYDLIHHQTDTQAGGPMFYVL